jgi:hypothetical protein
MMRPLTSLRANRIGGLYNFRSSPEKDFFNTICQQATLQEWPGLEATANRGRPQLIMT